MLSHARVLSCEVDAGRFGVPLALDPTNRQQHGPWGFAAAIVAAGAVTAWPAYASPAEDAAMLEAPAEDDVLIEELPEVHGGRVAWCCAYSGHSGTTLLSRMITADHKWHILLGYMHAPAKLLHCLTADDLVACCCQGDTSDNEELDAEGNIVAVGVMNSELAYGNPELDKLLRKIEQDFKNPVTRKAYTSPLHPAPNPMLACNGMSLDVNKWLLKGSTIYICAWEVFYEAQMRQAFTYPPKKKLAVPPCPCCEKVDTVTRDEWVPHARRVLNTDHYDYIFSRTYRCKSCTSESPAPCPACWLLAVAKHVLACGRAGFSEPCTNTHCGHTDLLPNAVWLQLC
jgi:hypothetical protein